MRCFLCCLTHQNAIKAARFFTCFMQVQGEKSQLRSSSRKKILHSFSPSFTVIPLPSLHNQRNNPQCTKQPSCSSLHKIPAPPDLSCAKPHDYSSFHQPDSAERMWNHFKSHLKLFMGMGKSCVP